jgi:hypothetical protein
LKLLISPKLQAKDKLSSSSADVQLRNNGAQILHDNAQSTRSRIELLKQQMSPIVGLIQSSNASSEGNTKTIHNMMVNGMKGLSSQNTS